MATLCGEEIYRHCHTLPLLFIRYTFVTSTFSSLYRNGRYVVKWWDLFSLTLKIKTQFKYGIGFFFLFCLRTGKIAVICFFYILLQMSADKHLHFHYLYVSYAIYCQRHFKTFSKVTVLDQWFATFFDILVAVARTVTWSELSIKMLHTLCPGVCIISGHISY